MSSEPVTFLDLCNRTASECSVSGDPAMASVTGQTGELKRIVGWVNRAYLDILGTKLWSFLWESPTLVLPLNQNVIATNVPVSRWDKCQTWMRPVTSDNADRCLDYLEWKEFSSSYRRLQSPGALTVWTIRPDNAIVFNAPGDAAGGLNIECQRWAVPAPMQADNDEPLIPADLRMLIVYTAMKKYAGYDEGGNQRAVAVDELNDLKMALYERCLPQFSFGGGLLDRYDA